MEIRLIIGRDDYYDFSPETQGAFLELAVAMAEKLKLPPVLSLTLEYEHETAKVDVPSRQGNAKI